MHFERDVLDLIHRVYECAAEPSEWEGFLAKLARVAKGPVAAITYHDNRHNEHFVSAQVGIPLEFQRLYNEHYGALDEWLRGAQAISITPSWVGTGQMLVSDAQLARSEFYNDHLRLMDNAFHLCAAQFSREGGARGIVSVLRPRKSGPFGEPQLRLFRLLLPHVQSALRLHQNFVGLRKHSKMMECALDLVAAPIVFVDPAGSIITVNRAADTLLNQNDGLLSTREGLRAASGRESLQLEKLIRAAAATGTGNGLHPGGVIEISRKPPRAPLVVFVAPVRPQVPSQFPEQAAAVVFITDLECRIEPAREVLFRLYGLTPAECELSILLMQGDKLKNAAAVRQITIATARSQLKSIFRKTNVSSQSQLARLLLLLPAATPAIKN